MTDAVRRARLCSVFSALPGDAQAMQLLGTDDPSVAEMQDVLSACATGTASPFGILESRPIVVDVDGAARVECATCAWSWPMSDGRVVIAVLNAWGLDDQVLMPLVFEAECLWASGDRVTARRVRARGTELTLPAWGAAVFILDPNAAGCGGCQSGKKACGSCGGCGGSCKEKAQEGQ